MLMHPRKDTLIDITDSIIHLVYEVGAGMIVERNGIEVFDISSNTFSDTAISPPLHSSCKLSDKIGRGWTAARTSNFLGAYKHGEIDVSIINHSVDELGLSLELAHLRAHI
jgi:hypothetical protein